MRQFKVNNKSSKKSVGFQSKNEETTYHEDRPVWELHGASKSFMNVAVGTDFDFINDLDKTKLSAKPSKGKSVKEILMEKRKPWIQVEEH